MVTSAVVVDAPTADVAPPGYRSTHNDANSGIVKCVLNS